MEFDVATITAALDDFKALIEKFADMISALIAGFKKEYVVETADDGE